MRCKHFSVQLGLGAIFFLLFITSTLGFPFKPIPPLLDSSLTNISRSITTEDCCFAGGSCCDVSSGLTFELCDRSRGCAGGRYCLTVDTLFLCSDGRSCICHPLRITHCTHPSQCEAGETCASRLQDEPFCLSQAVVDVDSTYIIVTSTTTSTTTTITSTGPAPIPPAPPAPEPAPIPAPAPVQAPPTAPVPVAPVPVAPVPVAPAPVPAPTAAPTPSRTEEPKPSSAPAPVPVSTQPTSRPRPTTPSKPSRAPDPVKPTAVAISSAPPTSVPRPKPGIKQPEITAVAVVPENPTKDPHVQVTPVTPTPTPKGGLAGDTCMESKPCRGYRKCKDKETRETCNEDGCVCLGSKMCVCNDDCLNGEVCSGAPGRSYCFSPELVKNLGWATTLPCVHIKPVVGPVGSAPGKSPASTEKPKPTSSKPLSGLTGDVCRNAENCTPPRECVTEGKDDDKCIGKGRFCEEKQPLCSITDRNCYCEMIQRCNCSEDCEEGEACVVMSQDRRCMSKKALKEIDDMGEITCPKDLEEQGAILVVYEAVPLAPGYGNKTILPEDDDTESKEQGDSKASDPACIDVRALKHFPSEKLVYEKHARRRVLCDQHENCATPGHIIIYKNEAMRMSRYCEMVRCENHIMMVNSPRWERGLRVESRHPDIQFTAYAARYETSAEERLMALAVRIGL